MAKAPFDRVVEVLRATGPAGHSGPSDAELLDRFRHHRDEEAFAHIVRRHGPTVLAAARQVLADPADVDDVFQAAFVVLFRKARSVDGTTVGSWLYAVAHRLAVRCRADARRRAEREQAAASRRPPASPQPDRPWSEAVAVLHAELDRLPDAYRRVLLLCYLRGRSREEAAADLGWSPGAVKGRLERGRRLLARRLARRGITTAAVLLAAVTGNAAGAGGPPAGLIELTVRATGGATSPALAALIRGVMRDMFISKLRPALAAVVLGGIVLAAGGLIVAAGQPPAPPGGPPGRAAAPEGLTAVTPEDLARTYVGNAAAGDERYLGKRIRLRGSVERVRGVPGGPGRPPSYLLVVTAGPPRDGVELAFAFRFDARSRKVLAALEAAQQVTVEGVCAGQASEPDAHVLFTDGKIIESPKP